MTRDPHLDAVTHLLLDYSDLTNLIGELDWTSFVQGYRDFDRLRREEDPDFVGQQCCLERLGKVADRFKAA
jgi:hypothetical protein